MTGSAHDDVALRRCHMPTDHGISLDTYLGRTACHEGHVSGEQRIPDDFGPSQPMAGFDDAYNNIIDYIVRITHRIWEEGDVDYIADTYSPTSRVFDDYGLQRGNAKIIADTSHTTRAFSDIQLIADDIVWAGTDDEGYHTSHRTLIRGTNDGPSRYGPATGRAVDVLVIANCVARDNEVFLEHVLYNHSSTIVQLGFDLDEIVAHLVEQPPAGWPREAATWAALRRAGSPRRPLHVAEPIDGFDPDRFVRRLHDTTWNAADHAAADDSHAENFRFAGPTNRAGGRREAVAMVDGLRESIPDLRQQVDEVYWMGNEQEGWLTSERWSATGRHTGTGPHGDPTGADVQIWGITQRHIEHRRVVAEWTLYNELDLLMQIARARS